MTEADSVSGGLTIGSGSEVKAGESELHAGGQRRVARMLAAGNLNGDGRVDLVVGDPNSTTISVLLAQ